MRWLPTALSGAARADRRRAKLSRDTPPGPLKDYFDAPIDRLDTPLRSAGLLAVDIETTGLDPRRDIVLAMGWVPIDGLTIRLGGARNLVVRPPSARGRRGAAIPGSALATGGVGQSAAVHGLTDDVVAHGVPLDAALDELLTALTGRVLVAHFVTIERDFLDAACRAIHGRPLPLTLIDTLELQRLIVGGPEGHVRQGALRLAAAREHFGLPRYRAHDALTDALACGELLLAQVAHLGNGGDAPLRQVLE